MTLTPRQSETLAFLIRCRDEGFRPSLREIAKHLGVRQPSGIICHLRALQGKGYVLPLERYAVRGVRVNPELCPSKLDRAEALLRDVLVDSPSVNAERIREYFGDGDKIRGEDS